MTSAMRAANAAHTTGRKLCFMWSSSILFTLCALRPARRTKLLITNHESQMRPQGRMHPPALLERRQDDVGGDRRPSKHVDADGIRDGIDNRAEARANRRLAHAPRADRRLRIGNIESRRLEPRWNVEDRQRPGVMEPPAERQAVWRFVDKPLTERVSDPEAASTADLPSETPRVDDRPDVADAEVIDERYHAGFHVHLYFREADDERIGVAVAWIVVLRNAHQAEAGERGRRPLRDGVDVTRKLMPVVPASQLDRTGGGTRVAHAARRIARMVHALSGKHVIIRRAAEIPRGDLLQLLLRIEGGRVIRPRHRMRGLAAH